MAAWTRMVEVEELSDSGYLLKAESVGIPHRSDMRETERRQGRCQGLWPE